MNNKSKIVRQFITRVLNEGDIDATAEYFCPDMVEEAPFPGQGPGIEGLKDVLRGMRESFPDMKWLVEERSKATTRSSLDLLGPERIARPSSAFPPQDEASQFGELSSTNSKEKRSSPRELSWMRWDLWRSSECFHPQNRF